MRYLLLFLFLCSPVFALDSKPYLDYSEEELKQIEGLNSDQIIEKKHLEEWDQALAHYIEHHTTAPERLTRVATYLYAAQRDFAFLSIQKHGSPKGSLDPVSLAIIRLFFPLFPPPKKLVDDKFSLVLGEIVVSKYRERMRSEVFTEHIIHSYLSIKHWAPTHSVYGKRILGWQPWVLPNLVLKTSPPPPKKDDKAAWSSEVNETLLAHKNVTEVQKSIVKRWGSFKELGNIWIQIGNEYLFSHEVSLEDTIYIRSILSMAIYDTLIIAFEGKYTYGIKPPYVADDSISPFIAYFYYPSYPSVHTMVSYVSALVLGHFFPKDADTFEMIAKEVGNSRLWAGVNYPIDIQVGEEMARQVYKTFLGTEE